MDQVQVLLCYKWEVYHGFNKVAGDIDTITCSYTKEAWEKQNYYTILEELKSYMAERFDHKEDWIKGLSMKLLAVSYLPINK